MERREFLKIAAGIAAGAVAFAATAQAAPLMPQPLNEDAKRPEGPAQPAVTSKEEADNLQPEEVRWGRGRHRGWGRGRHWGWHRRRHWGWRRRRYWGWHRRRRRWHRRYWRRRRYW
ncbi:MAG TPA: twin-arginine translocation signal domain-containing protein [Bradyrhizobium sp.]|nr:twin-arginine translocation signal domain-containing protein [Bradyrhizobium sp.]